MKLYKFDFIVALYVFGILMAETLGSKTFPIFTAGDFVLNASVAVFVIPLLFTLTDVITEVHGRARARSVIMAGLVTIVLMLLYTMLAVSLEPSTRFASQNEAYQAVFSASARIAVASLVAFAVSQMLDVLIFAKLRERMKSRALWFRNNVSNVASQFIDGAVFIAIAFYALDKPLGDNIAFLASIFIPYWILRCIFSAVGTPLAYAGVRWLKSRKPAAAADSI